MSSYDGESSKDLDGCLEAVRDHQPSMAKVTWGDGKGPYIFVFESSVDAHYCECNAHGFEKVDPLKVLKTHKKVPIYEFGHKTPEEVANLKTIDVAKYIEKFSKKPSKKEKEKK